MDLEKSERSFKNVFFYEMLNVAHLINLCTEIFWGEHNHFVNYKAIHTCLWENISSVGKYQIKSKNLLPPSASLIMFPGGSTIISYVCFQVFYTYAGIWKDVCLLKITQPK